MITLTDFLLARFDDDEATATLVSSAPAKWTMTVHPHDGEPIPLDSGPFAPARVLAECEAKRAIVCICDDLLRSFNHEPTAPWPDVNRRERHHASVILESLALPYADHPDYREEWKP